MITRSGFRRFMEFFTKISSIKKREKVGYTKPGIRKRKLKKPRKVKIDLSPVSRFLSLCQIRGFVPLGVKFSPFSKVRTTPVKDSSNS